MPKKPGTLLVKCTQCGGQERNHEELFDHVVHEMSPDGDIQVWTHYKIVKCMGCNTVRFRESYFCTEDMDSHGESLECDIRTYERAGENKYLADIKEKLPSSIEKMYRETVQCFNAGANTLAGGGLRATVEAICLDQKAKGKDLNQRINALVATGVLAKVQADSLHEERYIGNMALHEMKTPDDQDILDGLAIVEGLIKTVYVLPVHADRLKGKRESTAVAKGKASTKSSGLKQRSR